MNMRLAPAVERERALSINAREHGDQRPQPARQPGAKRSLAPARPARPRPAGFGAAAAREIAIAHEGGSVVHGHSFFSVMPGFIPGIQSTSP